MLKASVRSRARRALPYVVVFAGLFLLLLLRRPSTLTQPQLFAEDARAFFHDQVLFGGREALWLPVAGYLLIVPRLIALLASFVDIVHAPVVYNVVALAIAAACCGVFFLPAFRTIVTSDAVRLVACVVMAAGLDSEELIGAITQSQWYLQLAGVLVLAYSGSRPRATATALPFGLSALMLLLALSAPMLTVTVPLAMWLLLRASGRWKAIPAALLAGVAIQLVVYVSSGVRAYANGALPFGIGGLFESAASYLAFRPVLSSIISRKAAMTLAAGGVVTPTIVVAGGVLLWLGWLCLRADAKTRTWIGGAVYLAVASTVLSIAARDLQYGNHSITFGGERYFYLAACCLVVLVAITVERLPGRAFPWTRPLAMLAIFSFGLPANFRLPPYVSPPWKPQAVEIGRWLDGLQTGAPRPPLFVAINPTGWFFILDGTALSDGDFEGPAFPWMPIGLYDKGAGRFTVENTTERQSGGQVGLAMWGKPGYLWQLVLRLAPGTPLETQAMVEVPCRRDVHPSLIVEDGRGSVLATARANPALCGDWQTVKAAFRATSSRRVMVRLDYRGDGAKVYWDDVRLDPWHQHNGSR